MRFYPSKRILSEFVPAKTVVSSHVLAKIFVNGCQTSSSIVLEQELKQLVLTHRTNLTWDLLSFSANATHNFII